MVALPQLETRSCPKGFNHFRTSSADGFIFDTPSCHAEIDTLRKVYYRLNINKTSCVLPWISKTPQPHKIFKKITLYIMRIGSNGEMKSSAPCVDCTTYLKKLRIKRIVYCCQNRELVSVRIKDYTTNHISLGRRDPAGERCDNNTEKL